MIEAVLHNLFTLAGLSSLNLLLHFMEFILDILIVRCLMVSDLSNVVKQLNHLRELPASVREQVFFRVFKSPHLNFSDLILVIIYKQ